MADNPFYPKSKQEKDREEKERKDLEERLKAVAETAHTCLSDERFLKYRQAVYEARESLIDMMKRNQEGDPVKFALFCKAALSKIDAWDMIIDMVEKDARRR